jgi:hypothetical protein
MTHASPVASSSSPPLLPRDVPRSMERAERAYQGLTIVAMIVLLSSLCVFW